MAPALKAFVDRCAAYQRTHKVSQTWLSKRLFADTYKLGQLAGGTADVGVQRLEQAVDDLAALEVTSRLDAAA